MNFAALCCKISKGGYMKDLTGVINDDEYFIVANYSEYVEFRNEGLKVDTILNINEKELKPKYDSCVEGFIAMNSTYSKYGSFCCSW